VEVEVGVVVQAVAQLGQQAEIQLLEGLHYIKPVVAPVVAQQVDLGALAVQHRVAEVLLARSPVASAEAGEHLME